MKCKTLVLVCFVCNVLVDLLMFPPYFRPHIPYRDHKLTKILADCIGGSANTVFITTIGPSDWDYNETLSTLSFASRCMNIRAAPIQNRIDTAADQSELVQKLKVRK